MNLAKINEKVEKVLPCDHYCGMGVHREACPAYYVSAVTALIKRLVAEARREAREAQIKDDLRAVGEVKDGVRYGYVTKATDICDAIISRIENDAEATRALASQAGKEQGDE